MIQIFNIQWRNISDNLIPWFWRNVKLFRSGAVNELWLLEYVFCVLSAFQSLTNRLYEFAFDIDRRLLYTGQVTPFEMCLNDYFDNLQRRITISDAYETFTLYLESEPDPNPLTIYLEGEPNPDPLTIFLLAEKYGEFDFYVNIPSGMTYNYNRMVQIINRYRIAGMRFDIVTV